MNSDIRKQKRIGRFNQLKINTKLKKQLFGHLAILPCCYCKNVFIVAQLTIEHIIPLSWNGTNDADNVALACKPCNHARGREAAFIKYQNKKLATHSLPNTRVLYSRSDSAKTTPTGLLI
jgi:5-methylcytosine-specific restriction endonuclease McrA